MEYKNNYRWSPGSSGATVPDDARVIYSARWIDNGNGTADALPDRQGFAWNEEAERDAILAQMIKHDPRRNVCDERDQSVETVNKDGFHVWMRRAGGYVYVDAWLDA